MYDSVTTARSHERQAASRSLGGVERLLIFVLGGLVGAYITVCVRPAPRVPDALQVPIVTSATDSLPVSGRYSVEIESGVQHARMLDNTYTVSTYVWVRKGGAVVSLEWQGVVVVAAKDTSAVKAQQRKVAERVAKAVQKRLEELVQ